MYNFYTKNCLHSPFRGRGRKILLIMKLTTLILITVILHVSATTLAQKVTLNEKNARLVDVFNEINAQTGYDFVFTTTIVKDAKPVTINVKNEELNDALTQIFQGQDLDFSLDNKIVVIKAKETSLLDKLKTALNLPVTISGKVVDELGKPMVGVDITQKGTSNVVRTDDKGKFSITVPDEKAVLVFSYVGFQPQEIQAKDFSPNGVITMKAAENNLREVVISKGYYDEKAALTTGDVSVVSSKTIEQQPVSNPLAALEGRVPGLLITQQNGQPGGAFNVQIQGQNFINNNNVYIPNFNSSTNPNLPFIVIDGVPYSNQFDLSTGNSPILNSSLQGGNPLNFIDPYDIENIEVLKDADATAIYGSRAANGAILITTKKGKAGTMRVDLNLLSGFQAPGRTLQVLNTQQYLEMRHEAFANDGVTPTTGNAPDLTFWDTTRNTNWSKVLTQNKAPYTNSELSISGGTVNTQYLIGAGFNDQHSTFPTQIPGDGADKKGSLHFSINTRSNDQKFKISLTGSYVSDKNTVQSVDLSPDYLNLPPDAPALFNPNGSLNWMPLNPGQAGTWNNPYSHLYDKYQQNTANLVGNANLSYAILPNWEISANFGYTNMHSYGLQAFPTTSFDPGDNVTSGNSNFSTINSSSWIIEPQTDYHIKIAGGTLSALLGLTAQESNSNTQIQNAYNFISDALLEDPQAAGPGQLYNSTSITEDKQEGLYARLNYDWEDKYIVNVTARRDGSSKFGPGKQFGDFGAAGAAWIFSKEKWVSDNLPWLSFGKLRASYGITGSDGISDYQFISTYAPGLFPYGGTAVLNPTGLSNPNLQWEVTKKLEGGIDLGFFKDRIDVQLTWFRNRSDNQLVSTPLSLVTGFPSVVANLPALVQNTGEELEIHTVNIKSSKFTWSSSFNLTAAANKLLAFPGLASSPYADYLEIGQPLNIVKVFNMIGVNPQTGVYEFEGSNGQATYNPNSQTDMTRIVNLNPKFYGGFDNTFSYQGFSVDFLFQFVRQTGKSLIGSYDPLPGTKNNNVPVSYFLNAWQQPGDHAEYEKFTENYGSPAAQANRYVQNSDFAYGDASFIRLKNLAISWALPKTWLKPVKLQNCSVFVQVQNLLTFTGYNGIDPESQGEYTGPYKVFTFGIKASL